MANDTFRDVQADCVWLHGEVMGLAKIVLYAVRAKTPDDLRAQLTTFRARLDQLQAPLNDQIKALRELRK